MYFNVSKLVVTSDLGFGGGASSQVNIDMTDQSNSPTGMVPIYITYLNCNLLFVILSKFYIDIN